MDLIQLKQEEDLVKKADILDSKGEYEKALEVYDRALEIDPEDADTLFDKGETLKKMGRLEEAEKCLGKATDLACGN